MQERPAVKQGPDLYLEPKWLRCEMGCLKNQAGKQLPKTQRRRSSHSTPARARSASERVGGRESERASRRASERAGERASRRARESAGERVGERASRRASQRASRRAGKSASERGSTRSLALPPAASLARRPSASGVEWEDRPRCVLGNCFPP